MELVLASRNKKKIGEMQQLLSSLCKGVTVLSLDDIGFAGEIEEDGKSFEENALIKASVPAALGYIGIADDSGLCVDALGGAPGIFSARYSESGRDEDNNIKLLEELSGKEERGGAYVCAIACVIPESLGYIFEANETASKIATERSGRAVRAFTVRGECRGIILESEQDGDGGFGYDPLFYIEQFGKTFSQVSAEEKHSISHRGNAMRAFAEKLSQIK